VKICSKFNLRTAKNKVKYQSYIASMAECVSYINNQLNMPVVFLSFCCGRDGKVAQDILGLSQSNVPNRIIDDKEISPSGMIGIIKNSKALIGMRLHSVIFGCLALTPMLVLSYELKTDGIVEQLNLEEYTIKIDEINFERIKKVVQRIESDQEKILTSLKLAKAEMNKKQKQNVDLLNQLLEV